MRIIAPSRRLAPFVRELMVVEVGDEVTGLRLPEPGLVLGVCYRGSASLVAGNGATRLPDATLTGVSSTATRMCTSAGGGVVLARFHPGGAAQFFAEPLHELFGAPPDPVVAAAARAIVDARGAIHVDALARRLAISVDPLEKRFRRAVGASPKQLASLVRLRHAIDSYRPGASLGELAARAGDFDQSHFHRESRAMTGEAPGRFFRSDAAAHGTAKVA